ncbi:hypothetical protein CIPAW_10G021700 [Carya illinoinensis]|uniref:Uncharacterized protein n=1 Tax=Carya illinoinensis TaxID=32201 RepID=A0A8T1P1D8_CARIL|nr:hypothetical protein CIPAW_10G021700 [Carya illinoinensis]
MHESCNTNTHITTAKYPKSNLTHRQPSISLSLTPTFSPFAIVGLFWVSQPRASPSLLIAYREEDHENGEGLNESNRATPAKGHKLKKSRVWKYLSPYSSSDFFPSKHHSRSPFPSFPFRFPKVRGKYLSRRLFGCFAASSSPDRFSKEDISRQQKRKKSPPFLALGDDFICSMVLQAISRYSPLFVSLCLVLLVPVKNLFVDNFRESGFYGKLRFCLLRFSLWLTGNLSCIVDYSHEKETYFYIPRSTGALRVILLVQRNNRWWLGWRGRNH